VDKLPMSASQELQKRIKWMFESRSTITIREFKTLFRALDCGLSAQEVTGVFQKYSGNGALIDMYGVTRAIFGDKPAKDNWAKMSGCQLPGIRTPVSVSALSIRQHSRQGVDPALVREVRKKVGSWINRSFHKTLWSAYQGFRAMASGAIPGGDVLTERMFVDAMHSVDASIAPETAAAAFLQCDVNRDGSLDMYEFKQLAPNLDEKTPIWVTRKGIRLADVNPSKALPRTIPSPKKGRCARSPWLAMDLGVSPQSIPRSPQQKSA